MAFSLRTCFAVTLVLTRTILASEDITINPRGSYGYLVEPDGHKDLGRRGLFDLSEVTGGTASIIQQAWVDLSNVVNVVVANPNQNVLQNYFDPNDAGDVASVFTTVQQMIAPGGFQNPPNQGLGPTDLQDIKIRRSNDGCGNPLILAHSEGIGTSTNARNPRQITICDFGWNVLYRRLRRDITCDMIGPKVNYKMQFLGPLLLHEIFLLGANEVIDDMPGNFPCFNKAYGPYEAMKLRQRDPAMAKRNNENYVWYALVSPIRPESGRSWVAGAG
ncbi:MAG: hypothetical protein Q9181_005080 [Wetmoreana brouardii]